MLSVTYDFFGTLNAVLHPTVQYLIYWIFNSNQWWMVTIKLFDRCPGSDLWFVHWHPFSFDIVPYIYKHFYTQPVCQKRIFDEIFFRRYSLQSAWVKLSFDILKSILFDKLVNIKGFCGFITGDLEYHIFLDSAVTQHYI